jgi:hypothetical protein
MTEKEYEQLPEGIKAIVDSWDENKDLYKECRRIKSELKDYGWSCDYGLDGMVYDVKFTGLDQTDRLIENAIEIGYIAGHKQFRASDDSRETNEMIRLWTDEFTATHRDREWDGEWMEEIDKFAYSKIDNYHR